MGICSVLCRMYGRGKVATVTTGAIKGDEVGFSTQEMCTLP